MLLSLFYATISDVPTVVVASALYAAVATTLAAAAVALVAAARLSRVATVGPGASNDAIVSVKLGVYH